MNKKIKYNYTVYVGNSGGIHHVNTLEECTKLHNAQVNKDELNGISGHLNSTIVDRTQHKKIPFLYRISHNGRIWNNLDKEVA